MTTAFAAALLLLLTAIPAHAFSLKDNVQFWTPTFVNAPAQGRLVGLLEIQPRVRGDFDKLGTFIVRPSVGWRIAPETFVHVGYGWIRADATRVTVEHRTWQQFQRTESPIQGLNLTVRARLEQRMLEDVAQLAWRARMLLRAEKSMGGGSRYVVVYDEGFVHLNSAAGGPKAGFDQNRVFLGIGTDTPVAKLELGYQHVWLKRYGVADTHVHSLVLNAFLWPLGRGG